MKRQFGSRQGEGIQGGSVLFVGDGVAGKKIAEDAVACLGFFEIFQGNPNQGDRFAPVALAGEDPVPELVIHRSLALALVSSSLMILDLHRSASIPSYSPELTMNPGPE